jgi:hypothetical protein
MSRIVLAACCVICCFGTFPQIAGARNWECDELAEYPELVVGAFPDDDRGYDLVAEFDESDDPFSSMQRYELRYFSDVMYEWGEHLEDIRARQIPRAAREYHDAMVDSIFFLADVAYDVSAGKDPMSAFWDNDVDEVYWQTQEADKLGRERCGDDWSAVFDDDAGEGDPTDLDITFLFNEPGRFVIGDVRQSQGMGR